MHILDTSIVTFGWCNNHMYVLKKYEVKSWYVEECYRALWTLLERSHLDTTFLT